MKRCNGALDARSASAGTGEIACVQVRSETSSTPGLRWVTMALVVSLPWTKLTWAVPFLSVLATTPKVSEARKVRHKTLARLAEQMVRVVRRWLPNVPIKVIGDGAYSVIELGLTCVKLHASLIAPLRLDARLFAPPPLPRPHQRGRPHRRELKPALKGRCPREAYPGSVAGPTPGSRAVGGRVDEDWDRER